ncbi:hypothetical protein ACUWEX_11490 [Okibacterium fritillariae]|uniref:hypothetical protein n=1 Tax=Okibacterium fritillariae TaxID=123320 RepID=UPI0040558FBF
MARGKRSGAPRSLWRRDGGSSDQPRWRTWLIVGVALFLVIDVVVIALALAQNRTPADVSTSRPIPTFTDTPATPATPAPGSGGAGSGSGSGAPATGAPGAVDDTLPATRFIAADNGTSAWRATQGSCPTGAGVIERTTDGGVTWVNVPAASLDLRQIFRFTSLGASSAAVVGTTGDDCTLEAFRTFSAGSTWSANAAELAAATYIDPAQPTVVQTPAGPVTPPCPNPRQVVPGTANLTVLCTDQLLSQQSDGAWSSAQVAGALAATSTSDGLTVVRAGVQGCAGLSIATLPADLSGARLTPVGCLAAETSPAEVAISESMGSLWLWSNAASYVSSDGGATW